MKRTRVTRIVVAMIVVGLLATPLMGACSKPALAPAPVPSPSPAPAPAPKPPAPAPKPDPLAEIIAGAKKEGILNAQIVSAFAPAEVTLALQKAIKDKYGVDLKISISPAGAMAKTLATAIMEYKTGATPAFDIMGMTDYYAAEASKSGAFEVVDWRPLVEKGVLPEVMPQQATFRGGIVYLSNQMGLQYNPKKISAAEAPKKLADLLNPKWKGRFGINSHPNYWAEWAFVLGKDKVFSTLRSLVKTNPLIGDDIQINNRYLIGEIDMAFINSGYITMNRAKGMPTAFRSLDIIHVRLQHLLLQKGAQHPNAAKLLAIFLTSPEGVKFMDEKADRTSVYVPGNMMYDIYQEGLKEGLKEYSLIDHPEVLDFMHSPDWEKWQKEAELIIKGAG